MSPASQPHPGRSRELVVIRPLFAAGFVTAFGAHSIAATLGTASPDLATHLLTLGGCWRSTTVPRCCSSRSSGMPALAGTASGSRAAGGFPHGRRVQCCGARRAAAGGSGHRYQPAFRCIAATGRPIAHEAAGKAVTGNSISLPRTLSHRDLQAGPPTAHSSPTSPAPPIRSLPSPVRPDRSRRVSSALWVPARGAADGPRAGGLREASPVMSSWSPAQHHHPAGCPNRAHTRGPSRSTADTQQDPPVALNLMGRIRPAHERDHQHRPD
jgi:hypothetical protein